MRMSSAMGMVILSAGLSQAAIGETVTAEKKAPAIESLVEPTSASLLYRHYYNVEASGDNVTQIDPMAQVRANIGFNLLGKLDTLVIFGVIKRTEDQVLKQRTPEIYSTLGLFKNDQWDLSTYANLRTPMNGGTTSVKLALAPVYTSTLGSTGVGAWSMSATGDIYAQFGTRSEDATYRDNQRAAERSGGRFSLVTEGETAKLVADKKADPDMGASVELLAAFVPTGASDLKIKAGIETGRDFTPVYDLSETGEKETSMVGTTYAINRLVVSYKLSETLSLSNQTDHNHKGFYQARWNGTEPGDVRRLLNFTSLSYTLF
jgi:hypothetical protein